MSHFLSETTLVGKNCPLTRLYVPAFPFPLPPTETEQELIAIPPLHVIPPQFAEVRSVKRVQNLNKRH